VSVNLAAFQLNIDVAAAGIAGNDPEVGAEQIVGDLRIENRRRAGARRPRSMRLALGLLEAGDSAPGEDEEQVVDSTSPAASGPRQDKPMPRGPF
jgi:hypothetical protein